MSTEQHDARRYQRCCRSCCRLDAAASLIAGSHRDGERALRAEPWSCPYCDGVTFDVVTDYRDGDLDDVPVPIVALREDRTRRPPTPPAP